MQPEDLCWAIHDMDRDTQGISNADLELVRPYAQDLELYRDRLSSVIDRLRRKEAA